MLGPTASGKTKLACAIAGRFKGEVISVDSRQVYKGLDVGTGKDLQEYEINGQKIPVHLIDIYQPSEQFYLHDFVREAELAFKKITARNHLPVFCGGTGLYLDALRKDLSFTKVPEQPLLRASLEKCDKAALLAKLETYPPTFTQEVDRDSKKRIIRGLEIAEYLRTHGAIEKNHPTLYKPFYVGLSLERERLKELITIRLDNRLKSGLIAEVRDLIAAGIAAERLERLGLEYKFVTLHINGKLSASEMRDKLLTAIFQFSKRQMTWFRKMEKEGVNIHWVDPLSDLGPLIELIQKKLNE